jgi:hypothetical protein
MRQFVVTSADINPSSDDDCVLSPDDPIHALKPAAMLGGLGSGNALAQYNSLARPQIVGSDNGRIQREQNIRPGTDEWFKLWFSKPHLTGGNT